MKKERYVETIDDFLPELKKITEKYTHCVIDPLLIQSLTSEVYNLYRLHYEIMDKQADFMIGDIYTHNDGSITINVHKKEQFKPYISLDTSFKFKYDDS